MNFDDAFKLSMIESKIFCTYSKLDMICPPNGFMKKKKVLIYLPLFTDKKIVY